MKKILFIFSAWLIVSCGNHGSNSNSDKQNYWIKGNHDNCENDRMSEFHGVVDTCYLDYTNRGYFTALIKTKAGTVKWTSWFIEYPQAYIQTGDSIVKEIGTFRYVIYRPKSKPVTIDEKFDCDYWEKFRK